MRPVVDGRPKAKEAASTSEIGRFEREGLSSRKNLAALMDLSGAWIDLAQQCVPLDKVIFELDTSQSERCDDQQSSAYDGYFEGRCYRPLFLFNQRGDLEQAML